MQIVDTDAFLEMPQTSQLLYFHLCMRADDEGFVSNPKKIMRMVGSCDDDFKVLITKKFVIVFKSGVCVIKHWLIHNLIRSDRFNETTYKKEKEQLTIKPNKGYKLMLDNDNQMATKCKPDGNQMVPQVRLGKVRLDKVSIIPEVLSDSEQPEIVDEVAEIINCFKVLNEGINFGHKTYRSSAQEIIKNYGFETAKNISNYAVSIQGKKFSPIITNPYQLKVKIAELLVFKKREENNQTISL